jgi:hypothetical protein
MASSVAVDTHSPAEQRCRAISATVDDRRLWVDTVDGRRLGVPIAHLPWLSAAAPEARTNVLVEGAGYILYWPDLEEMVPVTTLFGLPP